MGVAKTAFIVVVAAVGLQFVPSLLSPKLVYETSGSVEPGFENVQKVFKSNFDKNRDFEGSAFAACHKGKMVVDLWGGFADSTSNRLWREDTMTVIYSTTKAVSALCLAVLVDRGYLKYSDLVTKHWPEFGQKGKDKITVKMLASHQAALVILDEQITVDHIKDWRKMSKAFETQKPNWELGDQSGYHAMTYGFLVDQLVHRVDPKQRSLGQFFHEEIAVPHNLDFYIGLPLELEHRVARIALPRTLDALASMMDLTALQLLFNMITMPADALARRTTQNPDFSATGTAFNNPEIHALEMGAANGIGTARALAKLFCLIKSENLLSKATLDQIMTPVVVNQKDNVLTVNITDGHGFFHTKNSQGQYVIRRPGYGGNDVIFDPHNDLSMAYVRNGLASDILETRSLVELRAAVYDAIEKQS